MTQSKLPIPPQIIEDLQERGMLDSTLVIWMGEFGRSPQITSGGGSCAITLPAACAR